MNRVRPTLIATLLLGAAAGWCYLETRLSSYPTVQDRALSNLFLHLQFFTAPLVLAVLVGIFALSKFTRPRIWQFAVIGAMLGSPALFPWVYARGTGESLGTLWLAAVVYGFPLGAMAGLVVWRLSRCDTIQLAVERDSQPAPKR